MIFEWCGTYKLDENKNPIPCSLEEWGMQLREMKKNNTKHVCEDTINGNWISTIWIGIDHQDDDNGPPLLFETMVFDNDGSWNEIYIDRYSTWQEAAEGHKKAVEWVRNGCKHE